MVSNMKMSSYKMRKSMKKKIKVMIWGLGYMMRLVVAILTLDWLMMLFKTIFLLMSENNMISYLSHYIIVYMIVAKSFKSIIIWNLCILINNTMEVLYYIILSFFIPFIFTSQINSSILFPFSYYSLLFKFVYLLYIL